MSYKLIIKYKIFEAQQRKYAGGNLFSNNHRFPNLPKSCPMVDIDNLAIDPSNSKIVAIVEDKFTFESSFGNPIYKYNWQKSQFLNICNKVNIDLIYLETSTNIAKKILTDTTSLDYDMTKLNNMTIIDTSDRIYVEIRYNVPKAVMYRTLNSRGSNLINDFIFDIALRLSDLLNVDLYLINDSVGDDKIYIKKYQSKESAIIKNVFDPRDWINAYYILFKDPIVKAHLNYPEVKTIIMQLDANKYNI